MGSVFKIQGKNVYRGKLKHWERGWIVVTLLRDKRSSERRLDDMQGDSDRVLAKIMTPEEWANRWDKSRQRQAGQGDDVARFVKYLKDRDNSAIYIARTEARIRAVLASTPHLTAESMQTFLDGLAAQDIGAKTRNHYLRACKMYSRWRRREGLALSDPLEVMNLANAEADRRRVRRALSDEDFAKLIEATRDSTTTVLGLTPAQRVILYLVATYTGLRAGELASLTRESFRLAETGSTVLVRAGQSKNRRTVALPIPSALVATLATWMAHQPAGVPLFAARWSDEDRGAEMLRHDLEAAGVPFKDAAGRVFDFHSLRVQTASNLARARVPLVTAQQLMRHSTPILTANVYTSLGHDELAAAVDKVPVIGVGAPRGTKKQEDAPRKKPRKKKKTEDEQE